MIVLILLAVVFALRAPASDLNVIPTDIRAQYVDSSGLPYFSEMDSYYNLRLTENYVDHGYVGDTYIDGKEMDMHRVAPDGVEVNYELGIVYVTSFLHDFVNSFGSYTVKEVAFWTGAFISCLAVIPAYIFARRLTNDYGAIAATLIIVLAPNYFAHTFPGFFDTDMFYYIFPIFFILFFVESMRSNNLIWKIIFAILSVISIGLFSISWTGYIFYLGVVGLFVVLYAILSILFSFGSKSSESIKEKIIRFLHQKEFLSIIILLVIGVVGLVAFQGLSAISDMFVRLTNLLSLQAAARGTAFPNVLVSVAEMQIPNLIGLTSGLGSAFLANSNGVINGIGGMSVFFAGIFVLYGYVSKMWKFRSDKSKIDTSKKPPKSKRESASKKIDEKNAFKLPLWDKDLSEDSSESKKLTLIYGSLFISWVLVCAIAVTQGSRFITTMVLPFAFLTGIFIGNCTEFIKNKLDKDHWLMFITVVAAILAAYPLMQINTTYGYMLLLGIVIVVAILIYGIKDNDFDIRGIPLKKYIAIFAICLALISPTVCGSYQIANNVVPGTSDPMWNSMEWIKENTAENAVITSWWDFGYLFEIAADRQVTFDGGSQSGERAFWLGQAMTTDDMDLSAGIFRMLNTEGGRAVEALNNYTDGDTGLSTDILIETLPLAAADAKSTMVDKYDLTDAEANHVIQYSHPDNPRPTIFVASSDMLQKAGWWSYFGNWDFDNQNSTNYQYYIANQQYTVEPNSAEKIPLITESGITFNVVVERGQDNNTTSAYTEAVYAENGSQIYINDTAYNPLNISHLIVVQDGYLVKNESINGTKDANYTLLLMVNGNIVSPILMSNELQNSMFTRLYLLGGYGQDIYKNVHMDTGVSLWEIQFNNTVAGGGSGSSTNTSSSTTSK
ncbi:dolichyl-diphosphooligosaccharide--protein glycosyltransferase subunit STT3 [Methanobrevibacter sp. OttesenSCG-928-I08]|nr:dolichyl-diphosphooligosaccharide--protein glycosyltransferase subunit STT3 [Methanobrevibacter sp. OttesenSCG-928-I08]